MVLFNMCICKYYGKLGEWRNCLNKTFAQLGMLSYVNPLTTNDSPILIAVDFRMFHLAVKVWDF